MNCNLIGPNIKSKKMKNKSNKQLNKYEKKNKSNFSYKSHNQKSIKNNNKKNIPKNNYKEDESKISDKIIDIVEDEDNNKEDCNKEKEIKSISDSKENHSIKETNSTEKLNNSNENKFKINYNKKHKKLLGKKRHLVKYKQHSLSYNELNKLYDKKEIDLNINSIFSYINLYPSKIKGSFIGLLENEKDKEYPDFIIEINNKENHNYNHFIVYNSKNFNKKLSFLENSSGSLYLLYKNYATFFYNESIKIYFFSKNNTNYDIFQKIILPEELHYAILFPFKFIHNDNFYFFYKKFTLSKGNKLLLYKFNKDEQKDKNDFAIRGKPFIEDQTLDLDFEFIWFAQKNNNELLFFYELDFKFNLYCYDLSTMSVTQRKIFTLINIPYSRIAQYANELISNRFLILSNQNYLYLIDTYIWDITVIKEHDVIEYFKIFDDNTLWTVESYEKTITIDKNKKKFIPVMCVRQYKINEKMHEVIKIGEIKLLKYYSLINNIIQLGNKKVALFVEGKKLIILK